ncbi:hypothetical protein AcW1_008436 [Taiwanofungus camphoratus]|nr:hypothetical protein AcW1_008436 [Antrodia cinnamomea]
MKAGPISASHAAHSPSKRQSRIQSLIDIRRNIKSGTSCPNCDSMQSIVALSLTRTQDRMPTGMLAGRPQSRQKNLYKRFQPLSVEQTPVNNTSFRPSITGSFKSSASELGRHLRRQELKSGRADGKGTDPLTRQVGSRNIPEVIIEGRSQIYHRPIIDDDPLKLRVSKNRQE